MKRFLLLFAVIIAAQITNAGTVHIKGKIINPLADEIKFTYYDGYFNFNTHEKTAKIAKDGSFSIQLPIVGKYTNLNIVNGDQGTEIYVSDGDDLSMSFDGKDFDKTMHYTGKGSEIANFVAKHLLENNYFQLFGQKIQPLLAKNGDEFVSSLKAELKKEMDFLEQNKAGLPASFVSFWSAQYEYTVYYYMLSYPFLHEIAKGAGANRIIPQENYKVAMAAPEKFNDEHMDIGYYRNYLESYFDARMNYGDSISKMQYLKNDSTTILAKILMPDKSREYLFACAIFRNVRTSAITKIDSDYTAFKKMYPKSEYATILNKIIDIKRKLGAGQAAIDFNFTSLDGKKMKLSDLKGKVVFLDFWASWCGPCMRELSYTKKVEEHFKDRDLVVVNVSIDEDQTAWKSTIEKMKIEGIHTCEPGGWKSRIAMLYGVQSVPSYFLIGKDGKFAVEKTPRPSDTDNLISTIEKAMNQ